MMPVVATFDMLLTLIASAVLYRKMKAIQDLFNTSKEIVTVGSFAILSLGESFNRSMSCLPEISCVR